jgi:hypothetical protein
LRFATLVESDWGRALPAEQFLTVWHILKGLPDAHTSANVELREIAASGDAAPVGYQWREGVATVIKPGDRVEEVRRSVFHEIGHSVHDSMRRRVDWWLCRKFGWEMFEARVENVDAWVGLMGGWPEEFSDDHKARWRAAIADAATFEDDAGERKESFFENFEWNEELAQMPGAERLPILPYMRHPPEGSWYNYADRWPVANQRRFCFNYMYGGLIVVNDEVLTEIVRIWASGNPLALRAYTLSSPMEFFADLYAATYGRHSREFGEVEIPLDWAEALRTTIGQRPAPAPAEEPPEDWKPSWRWVTAPSRTPVP